MAESSQQPKITLYWLEKSRSQRILWLLEELSLHYSLRTYTRGKDMLAGPELKAIHPLGKSPVISIQAPLQETPHTIAESGAIVEYLCTHFGKHLIPTQYKEGEEGKIGGETEEWMRYRFYMHYAEGSLMPLMVMTLLVNNIKEAPVPFFIKPITRAIGGRIESGFLTKNLETHFGFLEGQLKTSPGGAGGFLCGAQLTGADVLMVFPLEGALQAGLLRERYPLLVAYVERLQGREAYKRAVQRVVEETGEYNPKLG